MNLFLRNVLSNGVKLKIIKIKFSTIADNFSFKKSPIIQLNDQYNRWKERSPCPVCRTNNTTQKTCEYDCPNCKLPSHCSKAHYDADEIHPSLCKQLSSYVVDVNTLLNKNTHISLNTDLREPLNEQWERWISRKKNETIISKARNWWSTLRNTAANRQEVAPSIRAYCKMYSYPLTLFHILNGFNDFKTHQKTDFGQIYPTPALTDVGKVTFSALRDRQKQLTIAVLGARAEASIHPAVWREVLDFRKLYFFGPEIDDAVIKRQAKDDRGVVDYVNSDGKNHSGVHYFKSTFDNTLENIKPDIFVLYHAGVGFDHRTSQGKQWKETLQRIASQHKKVPILFTSFNQYDLESDRDALLSFASNGVHFEPLLLPSVNPFASPLIDVHPLDIHYISRPNHYYFSIRF